MTPQQLVGTAVRLFAVWVAVYAAGYLIALQSTLRAMNQTDKAVYAYGIAGWWLVVALLLWFFPMWIAHRLVPRTRFENRLDVQPLDLARVGCSLLGLWFLLGNLRGLLGYLFRLVLSAGPEPATRSLTPDERLGLAILAVQIVVAVALIAFSSRFAELVLARPRPSRDASQ